MRRKTRAARPYRLIGRRLACENSRFEVFFDAIEDPGGCVAEDFLIVRPRIQTDGFIAGVCVLPEVDNRVGLMRGYRHQLAAEVWQAPGGFVEEGQTPVEAALSELREETGLICTPERLTSLGAFLPDAGLIEGRVALFVARGARVDAEGVPKKFEVGTGGLEFFDIESLEKLTGRSDSIGGSTLVACFRYLALRRPDLTDARQPQVDLSF